MKWKSTISAAAAEHFSDFDPTSFHFSQVHVALDRELSTIGGWRSVFVLEGVSCDPTEFITAVLKVTPTPIKVVKDVTILTTDESPDQFSGEGFHYPDHG